MNDSRPQEQDWRQRLVAELSRDKKKTAILLALVTVAAIVSGRLLLTSKSPAAAQAAPAPAQQAADPGAPGPLRGADVAGAGRRANDARREEFLMSMDRRITRDLFHPNLEYFPTEGAVVAGGVFAQNQAAKTGPDESLFGQVRQWLDQLEDAQAEQLQRNGVVRAQAQALSLQSTMLGDFPTALINGQVLRAGDWISGFRIKTVSSNSCVVSKDGVDVELLMKP